MLFALACRGWIAGAALLAIGAIMTVSSSAAEAARLRPPATPLIAVDPYFSVWSMADKLTDDFTKHWTGANHSMCGMARIDGKTWRFMSGWTAPAMEQTDLQVYPTRTVYQFEAGGVRLVATFTTPLLMDDLDILSRPASYIEFEASATDGKTHEVKLYLDATAEFVVNTTDQKVTWSRFNLGGGEKLQVLRMGSADQQVLARSGDNLRIDWGYAYLVLPNAPGVSTVLNSSDATRDKFVASGELVDGDDLHTPRPANAGWPAMAATMDLGKVGAKPVSQLATLIYDDEFSVEYFHRKLRPYWRRTGWGAEELIRAAVRDYPSLKKRCEDFDAKLLADAKACGGDDYADICAMAYRQAIAAHKLAADADGTALFFSKENFSNGCMATVDVSYPSTPIFLLLNPELVRAMCEPIMQYSSSPSWPNDFAPHDIGTYPLANGQVYGGGATQQRNQMPVEESGNMLIMLGAMAAREGNADYAARHWPVISKWAAYLRAKGLDPENQLCTDDFAGHLAHNTNLSLKAIVGLACYAKMAEMLGKAEIAKDYRAAAEQMAAKWKEMANDGDHYRLAFDQPGTWSMKYNIVWDKILDLKLFDPSIAKTELDYYKKVTNPFGLPLDNRQTYTKSDWLVWTATLSDSDAEFREMIAPLRKFLNDSPSRCPFSDWYQTTDGTVVGFRARSVIGGVFIKMLAEPEIREKWARE